MDGIGWLNHDPHIECQELRCAMIDLRVFVKRVVSEPIGLLALFASILTPLLQSDWLWDQFDGDLEIVAHYESQESDQCSLAALIIENNSKNYRTDIILHIAEDWITQRGDEALNIGTRSDMMIPTGMQVKVPNRPELDVMYDISGSRIYIPKLSSGQYLDLIVAREVLSAMDEARAAIGEHDDDWNTPRLEYASSDEGQIQINSVGDCLDTPPS
jgi:hypothetical protein